MWNLLKCSFEFNATVFWCIRYEKYWIWLSLYLKRQQRKWTDYRQKNDCVTEFWNKKEKNREEINKRKLREVNNIKASKIYKETKFKAKLKNAEWNFDKLRSL